MRSAIYNDVLTASRTWIESFNKGDINYCSNTYAEDAVMSVHPYGGFEGRGAIKAFWQSFVATANPSDLQYRNVQIRIQSETEAVLSATWSMNVGSGFISKELWVKQDDGQWRLKEDDFSIVTQHETPRAEGDPLDTALIIVDLQNDYFEGGKMTLHKTNDVSQNAAKLLAHFRSKKQPVIHVQHIFNSEDAPFFTPNSSGVEIHSDVSPQDGEDLIVKAAVNSFKGTALDNLLIEKGIKNLVITGAMSQMCVDAITRHASDAGYNCTIIHDACAAPDLLWGGEDILAPKIHATIMSALEFAYGRVIDTQSYLSEQN